MPRDRTITALAECGHAALRATNGHGRRWAVARCVRVLTAEGTPAGLAERSALAMVSVAQAIGAKAAELEQRVTVTQRLHVADFTRAEMAAALSVTREVVKRELLALLERDRRPC